MRTDEEKRAYYRAYYARKLAECRALLGDHCARCEASDDLQFDHIDPKTKSFGIAELRSFPWSVVLDELRKCQLLCKRCHLIKTKENGEGGGGQNKWLEVQHGKVHAYIRYGCRCDECRAAKAGKSVEAMREHKKALHGSKSMYNYHRCRCDLCKEGQRIRMAAFYEKRRKSMGR